MNIVHAIPYFPPARRYGGTPEAVFQLVRAQSAMGHRVTVLTSDAGLEPGLEREGLRLEWNASGPIRAYGACGDVRILYYHNRIPSLAQRFKLFTARYVLDEAFPGEIIHAVHLHEANIPGYGEVARTAQARRIPLILSPHGSFSPPIHRGWKRVLHRLGYPWLRRWLPAVSCCIALCRREWEQLVRAGVTEPRLIILPYGCPEFTEPRQLVPFAIPQSTEPTALCLGRISPLKGIMTLVHATIHLWKQGKRMRLLFCGPDEGGTGQIIKALDAADVPWWINHVDPMPGVAILPAVSRAVVPDLFSRVDLAVCPSPYESFGLAPVEAVLCGIPAILTEAYGCLEHVRGLAEWWSVTPPENPTALAEAMAHRLWDKQKPTALSQTILPSWGEIAERTVGVYTTAGAESKHNGDL